MTFYNLGKCVLVRLRNVQRLMKYRSFLRFIYLPSYPRGQKAARRYFSPGLHGGLVVQATEKQRLLAGGCKNRRFADKRIIRRGVAYRRAAVAQFAITTIQFARGNATRCNAACLIAPLYFCHFYIFV